MWVTPEEVLEFQKLMFDSNVFPSWAHQTLHIKTILKDAAPDGIRGPKVAAWWRKNAYSTSSASSGLGYKEMLQLGIPVDLISVNIPDEILKILPEWLLAPHICHLHCLGLDMDKAHLPDKTWFKFQCSTKTCGRVLRILA